MSVNKQAKNEAVPTLEDSSIPLRKGQNVTKGKTSKEYIDIRAIKKLHDAITQRKNIRVSAIQWLEYITGYDFKCTKDFNDKMEKFFSKHYYCSADLRKARKWSGMERSDLADWFRISIHNVKQMETNKKPLSQDAIDFIMVMGFKKTVPLKKKKKKASEYNCIQTTKNDKIVPEKKLKKPQVSDQIKCEVCNRREDSWEGAIECINSSRTQFVCEDCIESKKKQLRMKKE